MASQWRSLQRRLGRAAGQFVVNEGPKLLRQLQNSPTVQRGVQQGLRRGYEVLAAAQAQVQASAQPAIAGRPVTRGGVPTARRARRISYAPDLDGRADPGEIVWTWVQYEDDPSRGKDRPVLVVGRDRTTLLGLMLSSRDYHDGDTGWMSIGAGSWDEQGRESWVRLDRVLDVPEEGIRREGAVLDRDRFERVAVRLRADFRWS